MKCGAGPAWLSQEVSAVELFAGCDEERSKATAEATGEALTAAMRERGRDVSAMSGKIERDSPLFFGSGDNPTLF